MRIGVMADIHANVDALRAVLADGERRVDRWWILGDVVGRGPAAIATVELLREYVSSGQWLAGNHDVCVAGRLPVDGAVETERQIWEDHRQQFEDHQPDGNPHPLWPWCRQAWSVEMGAPQTISFSHVDCWLLHGALGDPWLNVGYARGSYVFPFAEQDSIRIMEGQFERLASLRRENRSAALIHGHTHVPYMAAAAPDGNGRVLLPVRYGHPQRLDEFEMLLLNPGSVGQPRNPDRLVHAAYGILDGEAATFEFRRVPYDSEEMRLAMSGRDYDINLIHMLEGAHDDNPLWANNWVWLSWKRTYEERPWGWQPVE